MPASRGRALGFTVLVAAVTALLAVAVWQVVPLLREVPGRSAPGEPAPSPTPTVDLSGPLNLLLIGVDTRPGQPTWQPKADAVLVLHVPDSHDRAYLFSLPRDLLVDVPAFEPAGFPGAYTKLTHAMAYGSQVPGQALPDPAQGLRLLTRTVAARIGIEELDAAAVLTFDGFRGLVDAVGGIDVHLDHRVVSEHLQPDGSPRTLQPGGGGYVGPQKVYEPGDHHLEGWEALDIARQRFLDGGDYTRQRHHRLLVRALVRKLSEREAVTDPAALARLAESLGEGLVFDGRGRVVDFASTLEGLTAERIVAVGLPGDSVVTDTGYQGERLAPVAEEFLAAVGAERVEEFLADHPDLLDEPATTASPAG